MKPSPLWLLLLTFSSLSLFSGCSDSHGTITGNVTIAGQPLAKGQIQFAPTTGGTPIGAPIAAGKFTASKLTPGEHTVLITEEPELPLILSTEELQKQAATGTAPPPSPKSRVTPTTTGNSRIVTVKLGRQTMDFDLLP
jgi:hypothetical protein